MPRPTSVPKEVISASTQFQAEWKPDPQAAAFKVCKYIQSSGTAVVNPADLQTRTSRGVPWARIAKIRASDEYISSFLEGVSELW